MNRILKLKERMQQYPMGMRLFSYAISRKAPYFLSIKPRILELEANHIKVHLRKRRSVTNHIKTVHAIAMCNLCEYAAGVCMEVSIPNHRRWIPRGMSVSYLKKAETDLVGICDLSSVEWDTCANVICHVSVRNKQDVEVMTADIDMYVTDK